MPRLFLACGVNQGLRHLPEEKYPFILVSFEYAGALKYITHDPEQLIIDSGAFSAWTKGKQVDVREYADFCETIIKRFPRSSPLFVNLDVIPGSFGRSSTAEERKEGMARSLRNADYLRARGLRIMEVYHQDEPVEFLDELLARRREDEVLGISPRNDLPRDQRNAWMRQVFGHMLRKYGKARMPKCHGLAVTSVEAMREFPFYSVDSSNWSASMRWGCYVDREGRVKSGRDGKGTEFQSSNPKEVIQAHTRRNIQNYAMVTRELQELWRRRGVRFA